MEFHDLATLYQSKTDEELLQLARDPAQLTSEATFILNGELTRRRINIAERLEAFSEEEKQHEEEQSKDTGTLFFVHPYGFGRTRFGKAERLYDTETGRERFKTTVFIVLLWLPLIPTGTFLVEKERAFLPNQMTVLKRLPLDWEQVLEIWVFAAGVLLASIWALKLLPRLVFRR